MVCYPFRKQSKYTRQRGFKKSEVVLIKGSRAECKMERIVEAYGENNMKDSSLTALPIYSGFMMTFIWGKPLIQLLHRFNIGKLVRIDGPDSHFAKMAPNMGGRYVHYPDIIRLPSF
jgi:hypothetical protein